MNHRVYFSVCGEGYGHSSRDIAVANRLIERGAEVVLGSYGYVLDRLKKDFQTVEIDREFEMIGEKGAFDLGATIFRSKKSAIMFSSIISEERRIMEKIGATCVVADGRGAAVFAAFKSGIPCVIISNQTSLEPFFNVKKLSLRIIGKPVEMTIKATIALAEEVLIPDFPPPDTVCLRTLSRSNNVKKKQHFIGPVVSLNNNSENLNNNSASNLFMPGQKPMILTLLGGHPFRKPIFDSVIETARRIRDMDFYIFTKFKSDNLPENVIVKEFVEDITPYMKASDIIITQAGHSTSMELLTMGKPALIIPDRGQVEQEHNAARMKELGVAETLDYGNLKPDTLYETISDLRNKSAYKEKAMSFADKSHHMQGADKAAEIILNLSERIQCYG